MKEPARCDLTEASVSGPGFSIPLGRGCTVDLASEIAPGLTLREALGRHVAGFTLMEEPAAARPRKSRGPATAPTDTAATTAQDSSAAVVEQKE